jgi:hypothetical protein
MLTRLVGRPGWMGVLEETRRIAAIHLHLRVSRRGPGFGEQGSGSRLSAGLAPIARTNSQTRSKIVWRSFARGGALLLADRPNSPNKAGPHKGSWLCFTPRAATPNLSCTTSPGSALTR